MLDGAPTKTGSLKVGVSMSSHRHVASALVRALFTTAFGFMLIGNLAAAPTSALAGQHEEPYCSSAASAVQAFYDQLNRRGAKDLTSIAATSEAAAVALVSCTHKGAATVLENDRLRIRAADALFIAAEARHRLGQNDARAADLRAVINVVSRVNSGARVRSNERLYREARLLLRFARHFASSAQS
jgi:hypothetical protein